MKRDTCSQETLPFPLLLLIHSLSSYLPTYRLSPCKYKYAAA